MASKSGVREVQADYDVVASLPTRRQSCRAFRPQALHRPTGEAIRAAAPRISPSSPPSVTWEHLAPSAAAASFLRTRFDLLENRRIICGISFGHEHRGHLANAFRTNRASLDEAIRRIKRWEQP